MRQVKFLLGIVSLILTGIGFSQTTVYETGQDGVGTGDPFTGWTFDVVYDNTTTIVNHYPDNDSYKFQIATGANNEPFLIKAMKGVPAMSAYNNLDFLIDISNDGNGYSFNYRLFVSIDSVNWTLVDDTLADDITNWQPSFSGSYSYVKIEVEGSQSSQVYITFHRFKITGSNTSGLNESPNQKVTASFYGHYLQVNNINNNPVDIKIINLSGQTVKSFQQGGSNETYNLSDLAKGVYIVSVMDDKNVWTEKVFIE